MSVLFSSIEKVIRTEDLELLFKSLEELIKHLAPLSQTYFKPLILELVKLPAAEKVLQLIGNRAEPRLMLTDLKEVVKQVN